MNRRHASYTGATALCVFLLTGANAVRADIPSWFWGSLFNWADGVTAEVDAVDARVAALEAQVAAMDAYIVQLQAYVEVDETTNPTRPTVRVIGANLQVVSGGGATNSPVNGLGNIIVGYNEVRTAGSGVCSNGDYVGSGSCGSAGFVWAVSHKSGSHNLIIGDRNNYSRYGGIVAGTYNTVNGVLASVVGGSENVASAASSSVNGGRDNRASGAWSAVGGGYLNSASGFDSVVAGGRQNSATATDSVVSGGLQNIASADWATVSGGAVRSSTGQSDWRAGALFQDF